MHTDISFRLWSSLRQPQVRNLAWCVFSPSLVALPDPEGAAAVSFGIREECCHEEDWAWLMQLDAAPEPLLAWLARCPSTRLGFQFEYYWQFWWQHRHPQREYRFNVQLSNHGKTLGELDALSWHPGREQLTHTELAVKFYLGVDSSVLPADFQPSTCWSWVGPNVKDRLDLKWQQLQQRQLRHLFQEGSQSSARAELPAHWHCEQLQTRLIMRGRLFYPLGVAPAWADTPYVSPGHQHGVWLRLSQFLAISGMNQSTARWQILRREQWFAPLLCPAAETLDISATAQRLSEHFRGHQQPLQLAVLQPAEWSDQDLWQECQRWFVVPDQWPQIT